MKLFVVDERKVPIQEPYVVGLSGWSIERYFPEAPESARWEFVRGEVIVYSPSTAEHQDLVGFFMYCFAFFARPEAMGKSSLGRQQ